MIQPTDTVLQIERTVLGSCMVDEPAIWKTTALLGKESFSSEAHNLIFYAIVSLHDKRLSTDALSVCDWLEKRGGLEKVGGAEYIKGLPADCQNVENHARLIVDMSGNRRLMELALEMAGMVRDGSFEDNYSKAQSAILKLAPASTIQYRDSESLIADVVLEVNMRYAEPIECAGIQTGYRDFDRKFSGLLPGLHVIQGRTSSGKTWLALGLAEGAATHGVKSAFISLEMTDKDITYRRLSRHSHLTQDTLRTGYVWYNELGHWQKRRMNKEEFNRYQDAAAKISSVPVFVQSGYDTTSSKVRATLTRLKAEKNIGLAVVDYIQKFNDKGETQEMSWGRAAHNLKETADSLGIPLVLVSQVNRDVKNRGERFLDIGDARGSGQIDEATDTLSSITSRDYEKKNEAGYKRTYISELQRLKDRLLGHAGRMIELWTDPITGAIENLPDDKRTKGDV